MSPVLLLAGPGSAACMFVHMGAGNNIRLRHYVLVVC